MGNRDDRATLHQAARGFLQHGLGFRVQAGGWFVEDENRRIFQKGSGKGEALRLSAAETRSAFADDRFVSFRQGFDELV